MRHRTLNRRRNDVVNENTGKTSRITKKLARNDALMVAELIHILFAG